MANANIVKLQGYFNNETVMKNLRPMVGQKAQGFATSVLSVVNNNKLLQNSDPASIYYSAMVAASLDLPINPNLGFAAIVPYGRVSQFQIMTRGLLQLAIRSGQYEKITNVPVHKGVLVKYDPFRDEYEFDASKRESDEVVGYVAYFRTVGGFEKYLYMTKEEVLAHGKRYSKAFNSGPWKENTEAMCLKTVLKLLLSKYGILSIEMQRAIKFDQGVVKGDFSEI
jgi:recombination protein RecT